MDNLKKQKVISKRQFSFYLSKENLYQDESINDYFILGDNDPDLANLSSGFSCKVNSSFYWSVEVFSTSAITQDLEINLGLKLKSAIIDSGTSFIVINTNDYNLIQSYFYSLSNLSCKLN